MSELHIIGYKLYIMHAYLVIGCWL